MVTKPSFWEVARRPKWIGGLAIAMLVAVTFSLLMQWQLSRTFNKVGVSISDQSVVPIQDLLTPNQSIKTAVYDRLVSVDAELDPANSHVVSGRLQLAGDQTLSGYWLISNSWVEGASLTLAIGFSQDIAQVQQAQLDLADASHHVVGYLEPGESVRDGDGANLGSVSLAQLVNLYSEQELASYPAYVIVQSGIETSLEKITIGIRQQQVQINWLTAFYAVEWAFFALAAFYLWWRMVMDQVIRERSSDSAPDK